MSAVPIELRTPAPEDRPGWRRGELFEGLSAADFRCVESCLGAATMTFERSDHVLTQKHRGGRIGVLLSGVALDTQTRADGTSVLIDVIEPGDLFGDGWGDDGEAEDRALVGAADGSVILLDSERLVHGYSACAVRPHVVDNLLRSVLAKQRRLRNHFDLVTRRSLRDRLSHFLAGQRALAAHRQFTIPLSRAELAEYLHADRAALSRELARMQADGLISYHRNSFVVHHLPGTSSAAA